MPLENKQWTNSHFNRPFQSLKMLKKLQNAWRLFVQDQNTTMELCTKFHPCKIHLVLQLNAKQRLEKKIEKKSENNKSYWVRGLRVLQ